MAAVPAFLVLMGLGFWQLDRRAWKHDLIGTLQTRMAEPPLAQLSSTSDLSALEFRRVRLQGRFVEGREQLLVGRSHQGRPGYGVFAPFELADGPIVFVDRGWIPVTARTAPEWRARPQAGLVTVEGLIRPMRVDGPGAGTARGDEHYRLNLDSLTRQAGLEVRRVLPVYIAVLGPAPPGTLPVPPPAALEVVDNHLQYALTWFALAAALVGVYVGASWQSVGAER